VPLADSAVSAYPAYRPEYIDTKPALKIIEEALRAAKKID